MSLTKKSPIVRQCFSFLQVILSVKGFEFKNFYINTRDKPIKNETNAQYSIGIQKQVCGELSDCSPVLGLI